MSALSTFRKVNRFVFLSLFAFKSQYIVLEGVFQSLRMINGRVKITSVHGLRTPNEGINQRNLKFWADVADKICFGRT